jgi:hypothetical protein
LRSAGFTFEIDGQVPVLHEVPVRSGARSG